MLRKLSALLIILMLPFIEVNAQSSSNELKTFKFGKVDPEEFQTTVKGPDSSAAAIKLFDVGKGHFEISRKSGEFVYAFTRHVRFKVVNKNAYDLADFNVNLYNSSTGMDKEDLVMIKAATYNLVDGKVEVSKMTSDAKFTNRVDKNHILKKFTLPNVKEGSIIEYTYSTVSDFIFVLDDWYFQSRYPTKYNAFTLTLPEYYIYKISAYGYVDVKTMKPEVTQQSFTIPASPGSNPEYLMANVTRTNYYAENVPAIKDESYITTLEDYISKMTFEMNATNFPGSGYKDYGSTWPKLINELLDEEKFGKFLKRNNIPKGYLSAVLKEEKDSVKVMHHIFEHVKKSMKWSGSNNFYTSEVSPGAVLQKKAGNAADINLTLLALLNAAGIKADPVLLSTRGNGAHPGYPMLSKFNNVIVATEIGGQTYLLDATDEDNMEGLISYHNLNHEGLQINVANKSGMWISLDQPMLSKTTVSCVLSLGEDNIFKGNLYQSTSNYEGLRQRSKYKSAASEAEFLKNYKSTKPGLEIVSYKVTNLNAPEQDLMESLDVLIEDNVENAGNMFYFTPLLFERTKENPFALEERMFPVDFGYPLEEDFRMTLEYPASYKVEKLPKNEAFALPEDGGTFSILYNAEDNRIAIRSKITLKKAVYSSEEYHALKELFKNIVRKQGEQIVFKKI
jgi:hypothetical protein